MDFCSVVIGIIIGLIVGTVVMYRAALRAIDETVEKLEDENASV